MRGVDTKRAISECVDDVTLASFVDGRLGSDARHGVEAHLATCEACYGIFAQTARFVQQERPKPRSLWLVALPMAASLAVAVFWWTTRLPQVSAPTAVGAAGTPAQTLLTLAGNQRLRHASLVDLGAAHSLAPLRSNDAQVGALLTDLHVALGVEDSATTSEVVRRLALVASERGLKVDPGLLSPSGIEKLNWLTIRGAFVAAGLDPSRISWGEWLEAARLAAIVHESRFLADRRTRLGLIASVPPLPDAAQRRWRDAIELIEAEPASEADWRRLQAALVDVLLLL